MGILEFIIAALIVGALVLYASFAWGVVLFYFWGWFVLPVFTTLPMLNLYEAIGLTLVIGLFHYKNYTIIKPEYSNTSYWMMFLGPWVVLAAGWLVNNILVL